MGEIKSTSKIAKEFGKFSEQLERREREISPELLQSARNIIGMFQLQSEEDFVIVSDVKVAQEFPEMLLALEQAARERMQETKGHFRFVIASETTRSSLPWEETIGEKMKGKPILIITALSRSHSLETREAIYPQISTEEKVKRIHSEGFAKTVGKGHSSITPERLEQLQQAADQDPTLTAIYQAALGRLTQSQKARVISITRGTERDIFIEGAAQESLEEINIRNEKLIQIMKGVKKVHITSDLGTDFWIYPRTGTEENDNGQIDRPGKISNFPVGEWACAPWIEKTHGKIVVLDSPLGPGIDRPLVVEPVIIIFQSGKVITIEGGEAAERLKKNIETSNSDYRSKNPKDVFADAAKVAELGIGTNTKAFRIINGKKVVAPTSLEGEKAYGSVHVAIGGNGIFGIPPGDPEYNNISFHNDIVLPDVTVECYEKDDIHFTLIEKGKPIGY